MKMQDFSVLIGEVKYVSHTVDETYILPKPLNIDGVINIKLNIKHNKKEGHAISISVTQGFAPPNDLKNVILTVDSITEFKIEPYSDFIFKKPVSNELIKLLSDLMNIATSHNTGMFVIIREDYNFDKLLPKPIPLDTLKSMVYNQINTFLLN